MVETEEIKRKLVGRLKVLGIILLVFSVMAFSYSLLPDAGEEAVILEEELLEELEQPPPLNMILVSVSFALVGILCVVFSFRKQRELEVAKEPDRQDEP
jgi:hypothetical protein